MAAGLTLDELREGAAQRLEIGVDAVDSSQRQQHRLAEPYACLEAAALGGGQRLTLDSADTLVEEDGVDALLPGGALVDEVLVQPHPGTLRISWTCSGGIHDSGSAPAAGSRRRCPASMPSVLA